MRPDSTAGGTGSRRHSPALSRAHPRPDALGQRLHGQCRVQHHPPLRLRRGRVKQSPVRNLLERFWFGQQQMPASPDDLTIPFDNNQAKRDLRMRKGPQKVSGGFRSTRRSTAFARLRGYLSTMRQQGLALLLALEALFAG